MQFAPVLKSSFSVKLQGLLFFSFFCNITNNVHLPLKFNNNNNNNSNNNNKCTSNTPNPLMMYIIYCVCKAQTQSTTHKTLQKLYKFTIQPNTALHSSSHSIPHSPHMHRHTCMQVYTISLPLSPCPPPPPNNYH